MNRKSLISVFITFVVVLMATVLLLEVPVWASEKKETEKALKVADDPLGRGTPQGTVMGFMKATQQKDYDRAVEYLDTRKTGRSVHKLIQELQAILDRGFTGKPAILSKQAEGNLNDGLPPAKEQVGSVDTSSGSLDILLERVRRGNDPPVWLFSSETLAKVPEAYEDLGKVSIEAYLPAFLVKTWFLRFPLWQWVSVFLVVPVSFLIATILTRVLTPLLLLFMRRLPGVHGDYHMVQLTGPFRLIIFTVGLWMISFFSRSIIASLFWTYAASTLSIISAAWFCMRIVDIVLTIKKKQLAATSSGRIAIVQLAGKLFKLLSVCVAALVILYIAGINITAALTGLGIGGVALAFAAQKTLENFFGGVMVISDQHIHVGDLCKAGNFLGTVEDIGLRSTYLRTMENTVVAVPNGQLAVMSLENFAVRQKILFHHVIGLRYETTCNQLRDIIDKISSLLHEHPRIETGTNRVRLVKFSEYSIVIDVYAYILEKEYGSFLEIQEELLLRIMQLVEASGSGFAVLSQTGSGAPDASAYGREAGVASVAVDDK